MRVNGEVFFLLNFSLDLAALLLCARLLRFRFRPGPALVSAALGGCYALYAFQAAWARGGPSFLGFLLLFSLLAFGKGGFRAVPGLLAAGLGLAGCAEVFRQAGYTWKGVLPLCLGASVFYVFFLARRGSPPPGNIRLSLTFRGKSCTLPAFRDSGNGLHDPVTGLPVIIVSARLIRPLLPPGLQADDLSTILPGFRLLRVQTAAGEKTLICFHPALIRMEEGKSIRTTDAIVALSGFSEKRALLPEAIFVEEATGNHASL